MKKLPELRMVSIEYSRKRSHDMYNIPEQLDSESEDMMEEENSSESDEGSTVLESSQLLEPAPFNDIGRFLDPTRSIEAICTAITSLSQDEKYSLLYHHIEPPDVLPSKLLRSVKRKFNVTWLERYPWLRYSPKLDGVFCGPCSLLLSSQKRKDKGLLVNRAYSNWSKISNAVSSHSSLSYHKDCLQDADILKATVDNPASCIDVMASSTLQVQMEENKQIMKQIVRAIVYLAKQGVSLRGDVEDVNLKKNLGNFLALLKDYAESDPILHKHLYTPKARNATYTSPRSQNEIINVIGYDCILSDIVTEIKNAKYFSVLADEVSCHNVEHLPICIRFVDSDCNIREEFIAFIRLVRVRASDISEAIVNSIENIGLSLSNLRGQKYDGASTMSPWS